MEEKGCFSLFAQTDCPFQCRFPISGDKDVLLFLVEQGQLPPGKLCSFFRQKREDWRTFQRGTVSQIPSA